MSFYTVRVVLLVSLAILSKCLWFYFRVWMAILSECVLLFCQNMFGYTFRMSVVILQECVWLYFQNVFGSTCLSAHNWRKHASLDIDLSCNRRNKQTRTHTKLDQSHVGCLGVDYRRQHNARHQADEIYAAWGVSAPGADSRTWCCTDVKTSLQKKPSCHVMPQNCLTNVYPTLSTAAITHWLGSCLHLPRRWPYSDRNRKLTLTIILDEELCLQGKQYWIERYFMKLDFFCQDIVEVCQIRFRQTRFCQTRCCHTRFCQTRFRQSRLFHACLFASAFWQTGFGPTNFATQYSDKQYSMEHDFLKHDFNKESVD